MWMRSNPPIWLCALIPLAKTGGMCPGFIMPCHAGVYERKPQISYLTGVVLYKWQADMHGAACRHAEFEHYKASRPPTAEGIKKAMPEVQTMVKVEHPCSFQQPWSPACTV